MESARENNGSKLVVKRLTTRLDYQDARVDVANYLVRVNIRGRWYTLRLKHKREYVEKFLGVV